MTSAGADNGPSTGGRVAIWGDFSRTTLDPEDDKTFWTIQQLAVDRTHWATQITALHIEH